MKHFTNKNKKLGRILHLTFFPPFSFFPFLFLLLFTLKQTKDTNHKNNIAVLRLWDPFSFAPSCRGFLKIDY